MVDEGSDAGARTMVRRLTKLFLTARLVRSELRGWAAPNTARPMTRSRCRCGRGMAENALLELDRPVDAELVRQASRFEPVQPSDGEVDGDDADLVGPDGRQAFDGPPLRRR